MNHFLSANVCVIGTKRKGGDLGKPPSVTIRFSFTNNGNIRMLISYASETPMLRILVCAFCLLSLLAASALAAPGLTPAPLELGIDRSNMGTQEWSLSPPAEPDIYPFNGHYNGPGVFEARRVAVYDGIAKLHPQWFRDGFGPDSGADAQMFVDSVQHVHRRGIKFLAVIGPSGNDFEPQDFIDPATSGCPWGTHALSKINLAKFEHRLRTHFDALRAAGESVDAFEIGNELDLYCNDADMPKTSEFAAHQWTWFLTDAQTRAFAAGYAPFLQTFAQLVREYFPNAKIITFGMANPTGNSAPLIRALASVPDSAGHSIDYTALVDGYGSHLYFSSATTLDMVTRATASLEAQAAVLPHIQNKPLWITEWNEEASAFWGSHKWYFQYAANHQPGGDLNLPDTNGVYPAMSRADAIRVFMRDVIERLRSRADNPVNIGYLFYYSYDSFGKTDMCDQAGFNRARTASLYKTKDGTASYGIGTCYNGVIDPVTGNPLPDVAAALFGTGAR